MNGEQEIIAAIRDSFTLVIPEAILVLAACVLFVGATFRANRHLWATAALVSLAAAAVALWLGPDAQPAAGAALYASPLRHDGLAVLVKAIALGGGAVLVLLSWNEVPDRWAAEFHACLLIVVAGLGLTGAANELVVLFLALEMVSIPTYILLYLPRVDNPAQEAAMKYFLLSVFSSAVLLFGFSYLYGLAGTSNIPAILEALGKAGPANLPVVTQLALVMVVAGLSFRITAVPFHFYAPDVFQGTSTAGAAFLSFVPKVAGFAALVRVLGFVLPPEGDPGMALGRQVPMLMWILAAVTMSLGNVLALLQDNLKRLLAYSSVAHAGYMLIGLAVAPYLPQVPGRLGVGGVDVLFFYLVAYGAMTLGAFAVLAYLNTPQRPVETVDDLGGLSRSHPGVALLMAVFLFSLIGMPLTAGFVGKLLLFFNAMALGTAAGESEVFDPTLYRLLTLIGLLNAAAGAWYYLRIIAVMYLRNPLRPPENARRWPGLATLWVCAALTVVLGVYPWLLLRHTQAAVQPPAQVAGR